MKTLKTLLLTLAAMPAAALAQGAATGGAAAPAAPAPQLYAPTPGIGQPIPGSIGIQPQVTEIGQQALWMHNALLMPIITAISIFVLFLLLWVVVRYRRGANPVPSKTSHNTVIEIVWTLVPVLILLVIAVPSIKLIAAQYDTPKADLTVKVIGHQWYWSYQYPDNGDFEIVSNILSDEEDKKRGEPRLLGVDERMVVPAGKVIKVLTTSDDVIHSFAVPAFWTKMDAVPGRINETWFKVDRVGVYYGQCSELCGAKHGFMPIAVEVVTPAQFAQWVASKGGTMPGAKPAAAPNALAPAPASSSPAPAVPAPAVAGTAEKPATTAQAATQNTTPPAQN
ncbi:cytochrome c oxidase subunit II [Flavisphingomonas formosensis]|uniref:cytochrome c oxidase subunit II n=1 Tax=Flavisphingomonas formosensis TaxID=861534 RepID=UPI0012FC1F89|nr:cytochrome c oxidase subunit II [Sphingomonas formosensis]